MFNPLDLYPKDKELSYLPRGTPVAFSTSNSLYRVQTCRLSHKIPIPQA